MSNSGIEQALRGIAAGEPIDWPTLESTAGDDEARDVLDRLKVVAEIAAFHRNLHSSPETAATSSVDSADASAAEPSREAPATWGPLTIVEELGSGSFGRVYRAWDPRLEREVALKLLDRRHSSDHGDRAVEEGRLLARVRHSNIVTIHGADSIDGRVGLEMELVHGRSLDQIVREHGPLGADETAVIGRDVCRALAAIHRAGLVHRDVKAQNVMREQGGRIVLMDFGAGRETSETGKASLAGTPLYQAPEILRGDAASPQSDLYSLGVLLFYLVAGSFPVSAPTLAALHQVHQTGRVVRLRDLRPDLPERFIQVVERALAPNPDQRFETAAEVEKALSEALGRDGQAAARVSARRWLPIAAAMGLAAAAVVALATWWVWPAHVRSSLPARFVLSLPKRLTNPTAPGAAEFAISADGSRLAYSLHEAGPAQIFVRGIDQVEPFLLPETGDAGQPFFSPDARWVGYHQTLPNGGELSKTAAAGGPAIPVTAWRRPAGASWDSNGTIVFSSEDDLWRVADTGGVRTRLTTVNQAQGESAIRPQVLPGGAVLFTLQRRGELPRLAALTNRGEIKTLVEDASNGKFVPPGRVAFRRAGWIVMAPFDVQRLQITGEPAQVEAARSSWFDLSATGTLVYGARAPRAAGTADPRLIWIDRQRGTETPVALPPNQQEQFLPGTLRLSPDGSRIFVAMSAGPDEIVDNETIGRLWIGDLTRGALTSLTSERVRPLAWTLDSQRVTYRTPKGAIVWRRADGSGPEELLAAPETGPFDRCNSGSWSPDGRLLVLMCAGQTLALTFASTDARGRTAPTVGPFLEGAGLPEFSPDGRWIAYHRGVPGVSGSLQIFVRPSTGSGPITTLANRGRAPEWRGGELFFLQGQKPMVSRVEVRPTFKAGPALPAVRTLNYQTGPGTFEIEVSPDGRRLMVMNATGLNAPHALGELHVVLHWSEGIAGK